ncbi:hypothetical protein HUU53_04115 [Candidatus Micrarchaeota archaeon]|nr:hypothetical protein [Candidatus Micrarchaeota archaeon]
MTKTLFRPKEPRRSDEIVLRDIEYYLKEHPTERGIGISPNASEWIKRTRNWANKIGLNKHAPSALYQEVRGRDYLGHGSWSKLMHHVGVDPTSGPFIESPKQNTKSKYENQRVVREKLRYSIVIKGATSLKETNRPLYQGLKQLIKNETSFNGHGSFEAYLENEHPKLYEKYKENQRKKKVERK